MILPDDSRGVLVTDLLREDGPHVPPEMRTEDIPLPQDFAYPAIDLDSPWRGAARRSWLHQTETRRPLSDLRAVLADMGTESIAVGEPLLHWVQRISGSQLELLRLRASQGAAYDDEEQLLD